MDGGPCDSQVQSCIVRLFIQTDHTGVSCCTEVRRQLAWPPATCRSNTLTNIVRTFLRTKISTPEKQKCFSFWWALLSDSVLGSCPFASPFTSLGDPRPPYCTVFYKYFFKKLRYNMIVTWYVRLTVCHTHVPKPVSRFCHLAETITWLQTGLLQTGASVLHCECSALSGR